MSGRIPEEFIRSLLDRADIVEYVGAGLKLEKRNKDHWACCPFHQEKTPSFKLSPDRQNYYCFGCKASGNLLGFIMARDNADYVQAVETLAAHYGLEVPREGGGPERREEGIYEILDEAGKRFSRWLSDPKLGKDAGGYLKRRGLEAESIEGFGLGYALPGWDNLLKALGSSEERLEQLQKAGLARRNDAGNSYDMFRGRLMFPIRDLRGRVIGFGGRAMGDDQPKYINSPETPVFKKARELYGLYEARQAKRRLDELILVEGYTDVLTLHQAGMSNVVATLGTAANQQHFESMFRYTSEVVCCFDGDSAGRSAARAAMLQAVPALGAGRKLRFAFLPEGEDPDSLVSEQGGDALRGRLSAAKVFSEYFFEEMQRGLDLDILEDRVRLSRLAGPDIERLPEGPIRDLMRVGLAERTGTRMPGDRRSQSAPSSPVRAKRASPQHRDSLLRRRLLCILACFPRLFASLEEAGLAVLKSEEGDSLAALAAYLEKNSKADTATIHGFFLGSEHDAAIREAARTKFDLGGDLLANELTEGVRRLAESKNRKGQRHEMSKRLGN